MAIKTTRWSPDTCGCVIEYTWDNTTVESERVHTLSTITKCAIHSSQTNTDAWNTVLEENPRKNNTLEQILASSPTTALYDTLNGTRQFKSGITVSTSWSGTVPNRVLTITITGISLTTQQKNTIQTALNTRFGSGKVVLA